MGDYIAKAKHERFQIVVEEGVNVSTAIDVVKKKLEEGIMKGDVEGIHWQTDYFES